MGTHEAAAPTDSSQAELPPINRAIRALSLLSLEERSAMLERLVKAIYADPHQVSPSVVRELMSWVAHATVTKQPGYRPPDSYSESEWRTVSHDEVIDLADVRPGTP